MLLPLCIAGKNLASTKHFNVNIIVIPYTSNVGVKLSNMTMMIDNLITEGMAVRDRDGQDRRKVMVRLTPGGEKVRSVFLAHRRKVAKNVFSQLTEEDREKLLNSMDTACNILHHGNRPENGFVKYGKYIEFGDHMFFMRDGLIIALQMNFLGKWQCNNSDCNFNLNV